MLEARGVPTVALSALRSRTARIHPPRALFTGLPNSQIIGQPGAAETQRETVRRALALLVSATELGTLIDMRTPS
jgi:hypothetical protein